MGSIKQDLTVIQETARFDDDSEESESEIQSNIEADEVPRSKPQSEQISNNRSSMIQVSQISISEVI